MAGPTPVSALIHAATMVVAGVYLIARLYPVFFDGPRRSAAAASTCMAVIGGVTTLDRRACLAFVQNDIKKVLAYSTVSQLGYMVDGPRRRRLDRRRLPPLHPRLLQGLPVPRRRLGEPRRAPQLRHERDGRAARSTCRTTFWTFVIGTLALAGILPLAGLLVEGRDPGRRLRRARSNALHRSCWSSGLIAALHDRGLHDPGRLPHLLRRVPGRRPPRTSRRRSSPCPLVHPGRVRARSPASSTCRTGHRAPTASRCASSTTSSRRSPSPTIVAPGVHACRVAIASILLAARAASRSAYVYFCKDKGPPRPHRAQQGRAAPGLPRPREQVLPRRPLHGRHRRRRQGPGRPGHLLVQPERPRRHRRRRRPAGPAPSAGFALHATSTRASSTAPSTARATRAEGAGQTPAPASRPARSQQYAALLFGGAGPARRHLRRSSSRSQRPSSMTDFLDRLGPRALRHLPAAGRARWS